MVYHDAIVEIVNLAPHISRTICDSVIIENEINPNKILDVLGVLIYFFCVGKFVPRARTLKAT